MLFRSVTAMDPVMRACGGIWVAQASGEQPIGERPWVTAFRAPDSDAQAKEVLGAELTGDRAQPALQALIQGQVTGLIQVLSDVYQWGRLIAFHDHKDKSSLLVRR